MGCDFPQFIELRSLPVNVRADFLPTMWSRSRISGYESCVSLPSYDGDRALLCEATCHDLSPATVNSMYPKSADEKHWAWIKNLIHVEGGHQDPVGQLVNPSRSRPELANPTPCRCKRIRKVPSLISWGSASLAQESLQLLRSLLPSCLL